MLFHDHAPQHFHALYGEHEALIDKVMKGQLRRRALALVMEWAEAHQDELIEAWDLCTRNKMPNKIAPLK
jgi:hypothetical protein